MTHIVVNIGHTPLFIYSIDFQFIHISLPRHLALLKDRFLKKVMLNRAKTLWLFFAKPYAQIILQVNLKQFQVSKIATVI